MCHIFAKALRSQCTILPVFFFIITDDMDFSDPGSQGDVHIGIRAHYKNMMDI